MGSYMGISYIWVCNLKDIVNNYLIKNKYFYAFI